MAVSLINFADNFYVTAHVNSQVLTDFAKTLTITLHPTDDIRERYVLTWTDRRNRLQAHYITSYEHRGHNEVIKAKDERINVTYIFERVVSAA